MTKGDVMKTGELVADEQLSKTNTALAVGDIVAFDTDGWAPITATVKGPYGVNLTAVTAAGGIQYPIAVVRRGLVEVGKVTGNDIVQGQRVAAAAGGEVDLWVSPDWPAAFNEAQCQAEIDKLELIVGVAYEDILSAGTSIIIRLGAW